MLTRRGFLSAASSAVAGLSVGFKDDTLERVDLALKGKTGAADDEDFWGQVRQAFVLDPNFVNFNNGGVSPCARIVQDAVRRHSEYANQAPSYYMWQHLEPEIEGVRRRLGRMFGCDPEEVAITRNASESLETCLLGFDLQPGDEILSTRLDYPRMLTTIRSRERRDGVKFVEIKSPIPSTGKENLHREIVRGFEDGITPKTKLILVSLVSFMNGQIFPVREVCRLGAKHGIPVIVDAAHAFAQFPFQQDDLECEYMGTSLHKWLMAPVGTGMLYVKKNRIKGLWPLMCANPEQDENIRKYEEIGTHPASIHNAIGEAITFHEMIGSKRKEERFRYLRSRWTSKIIDHPKVRWFTSLERSQSCALSTVGIQGIKTADLHAWMFNKRGIYTTTIVNDMIDGLRVTPSVYSTVDEVDRFGEAMLEACTKGIA